jgi:hypothetical protein
MDRPHKDASPKPRSRARQRARASWIFSSVLLAFLMAVVWFAPDRLAGFKQQLLAVLAALLAGFMAFFLTGDLGIERSWLKASGGLGTFALMLFLWPRIVPAQGPEIYRLRVTVLSPQGQPVEEAEVRSSVGGERKTVAGGSELDIPIGILPADRKVTVYADKPSAFLHGHREVTLDKDFQLAVTVELRPDLSARVSGSVQDGEGHGLAGARVYVAEHETEAAVTGPGGAFDLSAHAAPKQQVSLHGEKKGFRPVDQLHPAGEPVTLVLDRQ